MCFVCVSVCVCVCVCEESLVENADGFFAEGRSGGECRWVFWRGKIWRRVQRGFLWKETQADDKTVLYGLKYVFPSHTSEDWK